MRTLLRALSNRRAPLVVSASRRFYANVSTAPSMASGGRRLEGKSAVVTGSTSGIGLGIAEALATEGCSLLLNGFGDKDEISKLVDSLRKKHQVPVKYHGADMSKPPEIKDMMQTAFTEFGGLHILVNNAGVQKTAPAEEFPDEWWDKIIAINLSSAFHSSKAALPVMRRQGWGRIINTSSVHGLVASVNKVAYVAAKHGITGMTKTLALETAGSGITVNSINPGWVLTPLVEKQIQDRAKEKGISCVEASAQLLSEKQPSKQFATPEQLGALVVFLCSDAASQITGISVPVDGGWTAQ